MIGDISRAFGNFALKGYYDYLCRDNFIAI